MERAIHRVAYRCQTRGWHSLRQEDLGGLWEHLVLDELRAHFQPGEIHYWRDKQRHELDFVFARKGHPPVAIECKWKLKAGDPGNFRIFKTHYPDARLIMIATDGTSPRQNRKNGTIEAGAGHLQAAVELALGN